MNDVYCALPWSSIYVGPDSHVKPCCISKNLGYSNIDNINDIWNNSKWKQLRLDMLSGVRNDICSTCYKQEDSGIYSYRLQWNENLKNVIDDVVIDTKEDGAVENIKIKSMDIRASNLCNFKCRTCGPINSSKIATEHYQLKNTELPSLIGIKNDTLLQLKEHYEHLEYLCFAGGEPMIHSEHWEVLCDLIDLNLSKNVNLLYFTNGSSLTFKEHDAIDYWKKFRNITVQFSIDAMGKQAEYWRDGTVWEDIVANIKRAKTCDNVIIKPHGTIGWPNIYSWISFVKYANEHNLCAMNDITIWFLESPPEYSLQSVPNFKKEEIRIEIEKLIEYLRPVQNSEKLSNMLLSMIDFLNVSNIRAENILSIRKQTKILDKIRNKNFLEYFPEHKNMEKYIT